MCLYPYASCSIILSKIVLVANVLITGKNRKKLRKLGIFTAITVPLFSIILRCCYSVKNNRNFHRIFVLVLSRRGLI